MKTLLLALAIAFSTSFISQSQENEKKQKDEVFQTLIPRGKKLSHGVYGGFEFAHSSIDKRSAFVSGFNLAWVIDHTVEIGFVGKGFITSPLPDFNINNRDYMYAGGYGGFHFAGTILGHKPINVSFPVTIGAGGIIYVESVSSTINHNNYYPENTFAFFLIEPGVDLQLNVTRFFRVTAGVAYRYTSDLYLVYSPTSERLINDTGVLRGLNISLKFKFGIF